MKIDVTYIGHSGYFVAADKTGLIFDYYTGELPKEAIAGCDRLYFFSSHSHFDHFNPAIFDVEFDGGKKYILSSDIFVSSGDDIISIPPYHRYADDILEVTAFGSTDFGVSFYVKLN